MPETAHLPDLWPAREQIYTSICPNEFYVLKFFPHVYNVAPLLPLDAFSVTIMKKGIFSQGCQRCDERGMCFDSKGKLENKTKSGVLVKS